MGGSDRIDALPDDAVGLTIPGRKIGEYLLNSDHPDGGPKAEFFLAHGCDPENVDPFLLCLFDHARVEHLAAATPTEFGVKFVYEGPMTLPDGSTWRARSVWFRPTGDDRRLLVTAYPF